MIFYLNYLLGLVFLLTIVSCKKDLIEDPKPNEQPIFKIEGIIGNEAFSAIAGDDGFLMSTFIDQLHHVDVFSGKLANADLSFEVGFFNGDIDMEQGAITDALLQEILFANQPPSPLLTISKNQMPNSALISSINWYIDGVNVSQNTLNLLEPGNYNVGANVVFNDGTSATVYNNILVGYNRNVNCQLRHFLDQNGHLQAWIDESSQDISSIKWYLDGELVSTGEKLDTSINANGHKVEAEILFVNGAKRKRTIWVDGGLNGKFIDDFASFEVNSANIQWDYKTRLIFKKDGKTYTTLTTNNQTSEFEVIDLSYYSMSSQGKPIYKIRANIECNVKEIATNEVLSLDATITFAIELK
jgi:hypothetical protein